MNWKEFFFFLFMQRALGLYVSCAGGHAVSTSSCATLADS